MTSQELFGLAVEHQRAGRLGEAAGLYAQILESEPAHPMSLFHLGVICNDGGDPDGAADLLTRALAAKPDLADARFSLGVARERQGRIDDAKAAFEAVVAVAPDHFMAQFNLGLAHQRLRDGKSALAAYRNTVAIAPDHAEAHFLLGTVLKTLGETDSATASYRTAAALEPGDLRARLYLGNALQLLGRLGEAAEAYGEALAIKPGLMEASCNLAEVRAKQGDFKEAKRLFTAALAANPEHAVIVALKMLEWGVLTEATLREAIAQARRAEPGDAAAASLMWFHAYRRGRLELACRLFDRFRARRLDATTPFQTVEQKFLFEAWTTVRAGDAFFAGLPTIAESLDGFPPLKWVERHEPVGDYLICLPCDGVYWRRFGADVVRSIRETCSGAHLHVHLCDPGEGDIELARSQGDASLPVDISTAGGAGSGLCGQAVRQDLLRLHSLSPPVRAARGIPATDHADRRRFGGAPRLPRALPPAPGSRRRDSQCHGPARTVSRLPRRLHRLQPEPRRKGLSVAGGPLCRGIHPGRCADLDGRSKPPVFRLRLPRQARRGTRHRAP